MWEVDQDISDIEHNNRAVMMSRERKKMEWDKWINHSKEDISITR